MYYIKNNTQLDMYHIPYQPETAIYWSIFVMKCNTDIDVIEIQNIKSYRKLVFHFYEKTQLRVYFSYLQQSPQTFKCAVKSETKGKFDMYCCFIIYLNLECQFIFSREKNLPYSYLQTAYFWRSNSVKGEIKGNNTGSVIKTYASV